MIKSFPNFSNLTLEHHNEIRTINAKADLYADFNFINLFCWSINDAAKVSILNDNLVVQLPDYISDRMVTSLLGDNSIDESLYELLKTNEKLELVPESVIQSIQNPQRFIVEEELHNHDYVYRIEDIVKMPGGKYKNKRNKLQSVKKTFMDGFEVVTKTKINEDDKQAMAGVFLAWIDNKEHYTPEDNAEYKAFTSLLANSAYFDLAYTLIRTGDQLVAFSVNEVIDRNYALCHFEKVIRIHPQLGVLIVNEAAKYLLKAGCVYVNWEQDLGIPGLRQAKSSYHPVKMLKKYSVTASG